MNRPIPIIFDEIADPQFGTGVVKVTPAHDPNDLEAGKRHDLPHIKVIGEDARMTAEAGPYAGLDRFEARKRIVADLEKLGLLEKMEPYALALSKCDRCGTIVEPLDLHAVVREDEAAGREGHGRGERRPHPVRSRQLEQDVLQLDGEHPRLVHFAPALVGPSHSGVALRQLQEDHRGSRSARGLLPLPVGRIGQDPDVLDTWFSSSLWPFSTLGWPEDTEDLRAYYPTSLMITGFDILFFWVARMMMMGIELTGDVPFRQVHMHGLVRDP